MTRARHPACLELARLTCCAWVLPIQSPTATLRLVVSCAVAGISWAGHSSRVLRASHAVPDPRVWRSATVWGARLLYV